MDYVESGYVEAGYFGQPGSLCAFFSGTHALLFDQAPQRPPQSLTLIQAQDATAGGVDYGYQVFASDRLLTLTWPRMQTYYRDRLRAWFKDVAKGMALTFDYRQVDGSLLSVRFGSPTIKISEITPDRHQVEVVLWVEL